MITTFEKQAWFFYGHYFLQFSVAETGSIFDVSTLSGCVVFAFMDTIMQIRSPIKFLWILKLASDVRKFILMFLSFQIKPMIIF